MTKLIVTPIDPAAKGSYRERKKLLRAAKQMATAAESNDAIGQFEAYEALEDVVLGRLRTDNGTPVEDVLDDLSADDFDALVEALLESPVPTQSAEASPDTD